MMNDCLGHEPIYIAKGLLHLFQAQDSDWQQGRPDVSSRTRLHSPGKAYMDHRDWTGWGPHTPECKSIVRSEALRDDYRSERGEEEQIQRGEV